MKMNIQFAHINIVSEDPDSLSNFYQAVFGCEIVPPKRDISGDWLDRATGVKNAHLKGMHLRLPGFEENGPTLEIYQYDHMEDRPESAANRKGFGHIAFSVDDVARVRKLVLANGGSDLGEITRAEIPGAGTIQFLYMKDPEGNILEIQRWN
jgi:predicted enzyme related to lactoylglutathione lyase